MKKCPYCGKEYSDDDSFCAIDQNPLEPFHPVQATPDFLVKEECQERSLIAICNAVSRVNEHCSEYTFGVDRAVKAEFRGREVCFVVGDVGTATLVSEESMCGGWRGWRSLYALAESQEQVTWMASNADVFTPVSDDSTFPVFWVNSDKIKSKMSAALGLSL